MPADPEVARRNAYQQAKDTTFTRVAGLPSWEQKEKFYDEAQELALTYDNVSHKWAGEYGLLAKIIGATRMNTFKNVTYVLLVKPPPVDPDVEAGNLTEKKALTAKTLKDIKLVNYTRVEGFRQGFGENFRQTFDAKY